MNIEFIPQQQSLEIKELGFDEPCFAYRDGGGYLMIKQTPHCVISAPTYSQAFRFFREKHNLKSCIMFRTSMVDNKEYYDWLIKGQEVVYRHFNTYEEAELECLKKLIEIVKNK
jgi:hypothetical protein